MKALIVAFVLIASTAAAQHREPKTVTFYNNATKEVIATGTFWGNRVYFRNKEGVHFATVELHGDGTRTVYDPRGKKIDLPDLPSISP